MLESFEKVTRDPPTSSLPELRRAFARVNQVPPERLFLTHGATEANLLILTFLAQRIRAERGRAPRFWIPAPEYPPLRDLPPYVGYAPARGPAAADVISVSEPNNPTGLSLLDERTLGGDGDRATRIVDQTFREFTRAPPIARLGRRRLWVMGTLTKVYGADSVRVGFVIPPEEECERFDDFHGMALDKNPPISVDRAMALVRHRTAVLAEARRIFEGNLRALRDRVGDVGDLVAPLWFDRVPDGDRVGRVALRDGVLVCSGSYFGSPSGVRICLTRRSFPADLDAYLAVRDRVVGKRGKVED